MKDYIYVGSYELRWRYFNFKYRIPTESSYVMVNYCAKTDSILEERHQYDELAESLVINETIYITDFEKQVQKKYTPFIVNNINLLRKVGD